MRKRRGESESALSVFCFSPPLDHSGQVRNQAHRVLFQRLTSVAAMATHSEFISFWKKRMRLEERAYNNIYSGSQSNLKLHIWEGSKSKGPIQLFSCGKEQMASLYMQEKKKIDNNELILTFHFLAAK